jgi:hypothetical protein
VKPPSCASSACAERAAGTREAQISARREITSSRIRSAQRPYARWRASARISAASAPASASRVLEGPGTPRPLYPSVWPWRGYSRSIGAAMDGMENWYASIPQVDGYTRGSRVRRLGTIAMSSRHTPAGALGTADFYVTHRPALPALRIEGPSGGTRAVASAHQRRPRVSSRRLRGRWPRGGEDYAFRGDPASLAQQAKSTPSRGRNPPRGLSASSGMRSSRAGASTCSVRVPLHRSQPVTPFFSARRLRQGVPYSARVYLTAINSATLRTERQKSPAHRFSPGVKGLDHGSRGASNSERGG